jgi:GDP-4-dehydro-6-deoxy-D-mannose reductase
VITDLCRLAGIEPELRVDPELLRADDPPRVVGDARALHEATGWEPRITMQQTLADVLGATDGA